LSLSGTTVTGINNLEIDGQFYDGVFSTGTWGSNSIDLTTEQFASDATSALAGYLHSGDTDATNWLNDVYKTEACTGSYCLIQTVFNETVGVANLYTLRILSGATWVGANSLNLNSSGITYIDWTDAPVSAVPLPAAVWLFGPALLGFLGFRRKAVDTTTA